VLEVEELNMPGYEEFFILFFFFLLKIGLVIF